MVSKFKLDFRDSADFLQENWDAFIEYLGVKGYENPDERANEILENLNTIHHKLFAIRKRTDVLFSLIGLQKFRNEQCFLDEFDAYLELKELIDTL